MRKILFALITLAAIISLALFTFLSKKQESKPPPLATSVIIDKPTVSIRGKMFTVEIADSSEERSKGLSQRPSLDENAGMLFVFENEGLHAFWMKDTLVPLDMIFIRDGSIVTIHENVPSPSPNVPLTQLPRYLPKVPVNVVLEINAGLSKKYGFQEGDTVEVKGLQ